jgi:hypothetical protein
MTEGDAHDGQADFTEPVWKTVLERPLKRFDESRECHQAKRLCDGAAAFNMVAVQGLP